MDRQTSSNQQWTADISASVEEQSEKNQEDLKEVDGRLERLVQDENTFVSEEITKNPPTGNVPLSG